MATRVNTKFVLLLMIVIFTILGGVGALWFLQMRRDAERNVRQGDVAMAAGDYEMAKRMYGRAVHKEPWNLAYLDLLQDALDGNLGTQSVRDAEASIGVLLAALAVTGYHWTVYQEDRALYPEETRVRLREVVYVGVDGRDMVKAIAGATGARVHVWNRGDDVGESPVPTEVVEALKRLDEERVLVIQTARGSFEVIPLRR